MLKIEKFVKIKLNIDTQDFYGGIMYISKLCVRDFRNLKEQSIQFSPNLNVLVGNNGMGKTNVLESIYFLSIGRSPRTVKDSECINFDKSQAEIKLSFVRNSVERNISLVLDRHKNKILSLDGVQTKKLSDIVGHFGSVYFSPAEMQLVSGSPNLRRRFVDIINCQLSAQYMQELSRYQHAIKQRNNYLKLHKTNTYSLELESWDTEIAKLCATIIKKRQIFVDRLNFVAKRVHKKITAGKEQINIKYHSCLKSENLNFNQIVDYVLSMMRQNFDKDKVLEYTSFGCHNDDLDITLEYLDREQTKQEINLKKNGSQGQQRTAVLALKLSEVELLQNEYDEPPVLLLDDVLGELDTDRQKELLSFCRNFQTIITCTEWNAILPAQKFSVKDGVITPF